jgi:hypothetical protein
MERGNNMVTGKHNAFQEQHHKLIACRLCLQVLFPRLRVLNMNHRYNQLRHMFYLDIQMELYYMTCTPFLMISFFNVATSCSHLGNPR